MEKLQNIGLCSRRILLFLCSLLFTISNTDVSETYEGYLGVEMESSTFFAVSNSFNVSSVAVMHLVKNIL